MTSDREIRGRDQLGQVLAYIKPPVDVVARDELWRTRKTQLAAALKARVES